MTKAELVELTERIMRGDHADEEEVDGLLDTLKRATGHPRVPDLVFWTELSAEEVVEQALGYRPFAL